MSRIIIGIHGLGNKPPEPMLKKWWKLALREGLKAIGHPGVFFNFELVYWADVFHPVPLAPKETDKKSEKYIEFPYVSATDFVTRPPNPVRRRFLDFLEKKLDKIFLNEDMSVKFTGITDLIIRRYFKDLDLYYQTKIKDQSDHDLPAKEIIRNRLITVLRKHSKDQILILAHSMGSIIAYEVLDKLGSEINIDTLVTFGSPLGQPLVMGKIVSEQTKEEEQPGSLTTPENVRRSWFNLSDLEDKVAMNYNLADDFVPNSKNLSATDLVVYNNYVYQERRNPHKSYGYLRTPEMAKIVYEFLSRDRSKFGFWLSNRISEIRKRWFEID
ncbi:MAG: alpha/beta hydrolase [Calditrichota bacterium]